MKPLAIDLFCGLGGWTEGLLAEGYRVEGFDIEAHEYGDERYPAELFLEDVLTLDGARFADAALIVASPPCQEYSYMAMPWSKAKAKAAAIRADASGAETERLNRLFNACFRIQREASAAAGRHVPLVVENVRGAIPWVGRSRWNYGSYHLWGDVPALMPAATKAFKSSGLNWSDPEQRKPGPNLRSFTDMGNRHALGIKVESLDGGRRTDIGKGARFTSRDCGNEGIKQGGDWFSEARAGGAGGTSASFGSKSPARKAASARIAKIPLTLSRWIAAHYYPVEMAAKAYGERR